MDRERRRRDARRRVARQRFVAGVLAGLIVLAAVVVLVQRSASSSPAASPAAEEPGPATPSPLQATQAPASVPASTEAEATPTAAEATPTAKSVAEATPAPTPTPVAVAVAAAPDPVAGRAADQAPTLPERMAQMLPGSRQLIAITGKRIGSSSGRLRLYNLTGGHWTKVMDVPAAFGAKGLVDGLRRKAGHLQTPTGIWRIGAFVFGRHRTPPRGTRMPYRRIRQDSWWSDEPDTYNTWVTSPTPVDGEHLADARVQYEYAFDSGYNAPPNEVEIGRGTAIFIHCSEPPGNSLGKYTHGCVAVDRTAMKRLFRILAPAHRPSCAVGTLQKGSSTAIWAY
jgi:L,D-peptidoglycan transpeptidase YkuD (ErfK/YbiS/YcfS/YnhG family)